MFEYVLHRVIMTRNGCQEDPSFKERIYDNIQSAIVWMTYNQKLDEKLYKNYSYYIEHRIKLNYDNRGN